MLAMNYRGPLRVRIDHKPESQIQHPQDAIVRVTRSCICGSDLHLYNGSVPNTRVGMTFGHEVTGVVEDVGPEVQKLKVGDHVLVPFNIACGKCVFCQQELYGNCHEFNPEATAVGGIFGYSHTAGGYDGGQAEYVRVPYADVSPTVIPEGMDPDESWPRGAISRPIDLHLAALAAHGLGSCTVSGVTGVGTGSIMLFVAEVVSQLAIKSALDESFGQLLEKSVLTE